uniref:DUF7515 domain-containing protein n=1 Tax=Panagrolaimus superbus TaxID=310955 RepID=A0A914Y1F3_9BILA
MRHSAKKNVNPAPEAEIPEWNKLQSQINIVIGSVRDNAITIAQLKKDILDTFAYDLNRAAQTYEYTSIEEMLSDMVGYVHVRHTPGGVIVSAAVVGSSAHVTEMIQKTKGKTRKKTNRATTLMRSGYRPHSHLPQPSRGRGQRRRGAAPFRTTHTVPSFGSSLPQSSVRPSSSRCYFGNQPSSSHVYRPAPVYESPFFDSPPLRTNVPSFGGPPQPPLSTQDSSAKLRPSVPSLRSAPSQSSSVRFATSASARLPSSQNFSFRPLLHKSFSSLSTQGSSINLRHSVPSFGPPPSQPLLSTQDSSVNLWRHLLLGSKRPSSNRPVPPPRSAVPSHSTFIPEKTEDPLKPRILSPSEALLWKKKTFADYATKVSFKSAVKN